LHIKFQNFSGGNTPGPPSNGGSVVIPPGKEKGEGKVGKGRDEGRDREGRGREGG